MNVSKIALGALAAGFIAAVVRFLGGSLTFALVAAAIGAGVVIMLLARSRGEKPGDIAREVAGQAVRPDPGAKERLTHEQLCRLNLALRTGGMDEALLQKAEELIDLLRETVPAAQAKAPGAESTYDLEQLAASHLSELLRGFLELAGADRAAKAPELAAQLDGLIKNVTRLKDILDKDDLSGFEASSQFVNIKFNR